MKKSNKKIQLECLVVNDHMLKIRRIGMDDCQDIRDLFTYPLSEAQAMLLIQKANRTVNEVLFGIYVEEMLIGMIDCYNVSDESFEIGYRIKESFRGHGYMVKALRVFLEQCSYDCVIAHVSDGNAVSKHILESNGFQLKNHTYRWSRSCHED